MSQKASPRRLLRLEKRKGGASVTRGGFKAKSRSCLHHGVHQITIKGTCKKRDVDGKGGRQGEDSAGKPTLLLVLQSVRTVLLRAVSWKADRDA